MIRGGIDFVQKFQETFRATVLECHGKSNFAVNDFVGCNDVIFFHDCETLALECDYSA